MPREDCPAVLSCRRAPLQWRQQNDGAGDALEAHFGAVSTAIAAVFSAIEEELFQWEEVSIELPGSAFTGDCPRATYCAPPEGHMSPIAGRHDRKAQENRTALFPELSSHKRETPECLELGGSKLSPSQLESIWKTGAFEVESKRFPGTVHRWRVNPLISEGLDNLKEHFAQRCANAVEHISYGISDRLICSNGPSVLHAMKCMGRSVTSVADALIGVPTYQTPGSLTQSLTEAKVRYSVLEFYDSIAMEAVEREEYQRSRIEQDFYDHQGRGVYTQSEGAAENAPSTLDLRLWLGSGSFAELCRIAALPILDKIQREFLGRRRGIVEELLANSEAEGLSEEEAVAWLQDSCETLLLREVEEELSKLEIFASESGEGVLVRIIAAVKVNTTRSRVSAEVNQERLSTIQQTRNRLKEEHRIFGKIERWLANRTETEVRRMLKVPPEVRLDRYWKLVEERRCIERLEALHDPRLEQDIYLLKRGLQWEEEHYIHVVAEVTEVEKTPAFKRVFKRWWWNSKKGSFGCPQKGTPMPCTSTFYGWRLHCIGAGTIDLSTRIAIASLNVMLWGRFSMRALFLREEFKHPLAPKHQPSTPTYRSMLKGAVALYRASVARFESQPDTGMLGKGVSRVFHRTFTGLLMCGSLALIGVLMPALCVLVTVGTGALAVLSPLIASGVSLSVYGFQLIRTLIVTTLKVTVIRPLEAVGSLLAAALYHPTWAALTQALALGKFSFGYFYYSLCQKVISSTGKVPRTDSFAARRVAGPGLSFKTYKKCSLPGALAVVRVKLEEMELELIEQTSVQCVTQPLTLFRRMITQITKPFASSVTPHNAFLQNESEVLSRMIQSTCQRRRLELPMVVHSSEFVRLEPEDFDALMDLSTTLVRDFVEARIFNDLFNGSAFLVKEFWRQHALREGAFEEMAKGLLVSGLGPDVLLPLTKEDCSVEIHVEDVPGMHKFLSMAVRAKRPLEPLSATAVSIRRALEKEAPICGGFSTVVGDSTAKGLQPFQLVSVSLPSKPQKETQGTLPSQAEYQSLLSVNE